MNFKILAIRDWLRLFNRQGVFMMLMPTVSEQQGRNPHAKHNSLQRWRGVKSPWIRATWQCWVALLASKRLR